MYAQTNSYKFEITHIDLNRLIKNSNKFEITNMDLKIKLLFIKIDGERVSTLGGFRSQRFRCDVREVRVSLEDKSVPLPDRIRIEINVGGLGVLS